MYLPVDYTWLSSTTIHICICPPKVFEMFQIRNQFLYLIVYIFPEPNTSWYDPSSSMSLLHFESIAYFSHSKKLVGPSWEPRRGHTSIFLTGMLVPEQISTTQKNRMTLNPNPRKIECPKIQTQKNRMTQDVMLVKVWINMKSYYYFMFFSTVCCWFKGFKCVIQKLEDPKK